jgi:membrane-bound lytic murein transglycosylase C
MFIQKVTAYAAIALIGAGGMHLTWADVDLSPSSNREYAITQLSFAQSVSSDDIDMSSRWTPEAEVHLRQEVSRVWGANEVRVPETREYVKYTQGYRARADVDFENGVLVVETVDTINPVRSLKEAVVSTLLTPGDYTRVDLYSDKEPPMDGTPFLYGHVLDSEGRPIRAGVRASAYADQLLETRAESRRITVNGRKTTVLRVSIPLDKTHLSQRARKYEHLVARNAERFGLSERLIYAIAKTESSFNPFAVSSANAYGLMQVVPSSAGREVRKHLTGKNQKPTPKFLLDPANSIEYGSAYLHILAQRYFGEVKDLASRELCTIAAYNGGPGTVLRVFGKDQASAIRAINAMSPREVYYRLTRKLPAAETRRYVDKVLKNLDLFTAKG